MTKHLKIDDEQKVEFNIQGTKILVSAQKDQLIIETDSFLFKGKLCDSGCKNYMHPHLVNACGISDTFSVRQNELCFNYDEKEGGLDEKTFFIPILSS